MAKKAPPPEEIEQEEDETVEDESEEEEDEKPHPSRTARLQYVQNRVCNLLERLLGYDEDGKRRVIRGLGALLEEGEDDG